MMTSWIIPCNLKNYDVIGAFKRFRKLNWKQSAKSIEVGDTVFIYIGKPVSGIKYKCKVNKVNLKNREIIDDVFVINGEPYMEYGNYMELELLEVIDSQKYSLDYLNSHGVNGTIQGPRRVNALFDDKNKTISIGSDHEKTEVKTTPVKKNKDKKQAIGGKTRLKRLMKRVLSKCNIAYEGHVISKEQLMRAYALFLLQTMVKKEHNVGMVLHTGSLCFDVITVVYVAILNMISNSTGSGDVIENLNIGDLVIYGTNKRERYEFGGIIDGKELDPNVAGIKYATLKQKGDRRYVRETEWRYIEPYYGKSNILDGRGIKKKEKTKEDFYIEILDYAKEDVPNIIDTSSVIVASRAKSDQLIKNISISFGEKTVSLLDLVTASYFTEDEEYNYGGNSGKNEAVLKFCSKVSVARKQVLSKSGNKHLGVVVMGHSTITRGITQLPQLLNRKSLKYVLVSCRVDPIFIKNLSPDLVDVEIFICTKKYLEQYNQICIENRYTAELNNQINRIINKNTIGINIDRFPIDIAEYKQFGRILVEMKRDEYVPAPVADFTIKAYSLMNLFMTTPVSIQQLNHIITKYLSTITAPEDKMSNIQKIVNDNTGEYFEKLKKVENILLTTYTGLLEENLKGTWITNYIQKNMKKKIAIIVPKAYFKDAIKKSALLPANIFRSNVSIHTFSKFDNNNYYDAIIVLGTKRESKFNPFTSFSAEEIFSLLYPIEMLQYKKNKHQYDQALRDILKHASNITLPDDEYDDYQDNHDLEEVVNNEQEIEDYMDEALFYVNEVQKDNSGRGNFLTEISAVAVLEDERKVFFSKHYKAYVLDTDGAGIREVGTAELSEGDSIVFTKKNNDTRDIVDTILRQLMDSGKLNRQQIEVYNNSNVWKKCLHNYMIDNNLSGHEVAARMVKLGAPVMESTVKNWMDEDSHTVGPRNIESLTTIGKLTGNISLEKESEMYFSMCRQMRSLRRSILKNIGDMIKDKIRGKEPPKDSLLYDIYGKLDDIAEILQIESIKNVEQQIPGSKANRPISYMG